MPGVDHLVNAGARPKINAGIITAFKEVADRAVDIEGAYFKNRFVFKIAWQNFFY